MHGSYSGRLTTGRDGVSAVRVMTDRGSSDRVEGKVQRD